MRVVLLDDCEMDRVMTKDFLKIYFEQRRFTEYSITEYSDTERLLANFSPHTVDLLILDIYMPGKNGLEAAHEIQQLDSSVRIVFLTSSVDHVLQGYEVQARGYILKPLTKHQRSFYRFMDYALQDFLNMRRIYSATTTCGTISVPFDKILYIESNNRKVYLHIDGKVLPLTAKMNDIRMKLTEKEGFIECYRDLLVNLDRVSDTKGLELILDNEERIPVSRRKKLPVQNSYLSRVAMKKI